ncbi:ABC transporter substrate-binding protein [Streptomyces zhihengii]|uniref:ABC transporter substrate-binding protein n=1 Tax=Streptomyces zhihengii TaxID=1818004 RepID=UPI0033B07248
MHAIAQHRKAFMRVGIATSFAATGMLLVSSCGDPGEPDPSGSSHQAAAEAPLHHLLPPEIAEQGFITVGSDIAFPPVEFEDGSGNIVGVDPDIAQEMGRKLGVQFKFENAPFDTLVTDLNSGRFDIAMSAMTDTKERRDGIDPETGQKVGEGVDFVDYFTAGISLYTLTSSNADLKDWKDLCGMSVAVQAGTVAHDIAQSQEERCAEGPAGQLKIEQFDSDEQAQARVFAGGADVGASDYPVAAYAVKQAEGDSLRIVGRQLGAAPYGIATRKSEGQLREALRAALNAIIQDGSYGKVLAKWGLAEGAVDKARTNTGR